LNGLTAGNYIPRYTAFGNSKFNERITPDRFSARQLQTVYDALGRCAYALVGDPVAERRHPDGHENPHQGDDNRHLDEAKAILGSAVH
jgi:hypothetical protein